jgi:formate hydrogenlyase subunit 6/NADH:ubiquinone oxidoreductase subunit I
MELRHLKRIRRGVSVGLFVLSGFLFVDLGGVIPPQLTNIVVSFQFIPALVKTVSTFGLWTIGLGVIVLMTMAFGRIYCSSLCPLGTLQDFFIYVTLRWKKRRHRRRWYDYQHPPYLFHYALLALLAISAIAGFFFLLNLLEPFSNFGRITGTFVRPLILAANNGIASVLETFRSFSLYRIPVHAIQLEVIAGTGLFFVVVAYLSVKHGRLFCNLLCPAGAALSLLSRFALLKIVIDRDSCNDCGLCEKVCKAKCIDSEAKKIDFAACVSCFNCIDVCPTVGVKYEGMFSRTRTVAPGPLSPARREFLKTSALPILLVAGSSTDSTTTVGKSRSKNPVTPPGSQGIAHFSERCTACQLCVSVCPTQVIRPSLVDYGVAGIFQPRMDYRINYCTYECTLCTSVCPTGAILPLALDAKKLVQIGKVQFVKDDCVVVSKKKDCAACSEHCPTKAVQMVPYEGKLMIPETNNEICIGCGACEHACPVTPQKAIYVESNALHLRAKKPEIKKLEQPVDTGKDFPF